MTSAKRDTLDHEEVVTAGTQRIGAVTGNHVEGYRAYDDNDELLDTYTTISAARRAVYEHHTGAGERQW